MNVNPFSWIFNALVIGFPEVGGPRADVGKYGDFMGTLEQISAPVVGEMWGFLNALLSGRMWGLRFCSTERRLGTIDCSLDRWQDGGGEIQNRVNTNC